MPRERLRLVCNHMRYYSYANCVQSRSLSRPEAPPVLGELARKALLQLPAMPLACWLCPDLILNCAQSILEQLLQSAYGDHVVCQRTLYIDSKRAVLEESSTSLSMQDSLPDE